MDASETRTTYHHGNLKAALLQAAISLIEEKGPEAATVTEAAKRAGVSSGAPFRHFATKAALLTAVAEVFQAELIARMEAAQAPSAYQSLKAMGMAFVDWGLEQSTHFRVYSNRNLYEFESSERLIAGDLHLAEMVIGRFAELQPPGAEPTRARRLYVDSRALLTGLVTLYCNGHFPRFRLDEPAHATMEKSWELFLSSVTGGE